MAASKYDNALDEGLDVAARSRDARPVLFRDELVSAIFKSFGARRSVLVVGPTGVGKTSVIRAVATRMAQAGPHNLFEFSTIQILAGTVYLGEWQTKATAIFNAATKNKARLYFSDVWNLPLAGRSSNRDDSVWDALRPRLLNGELQIIGEVSPEQLLALSAFPGFTAPFDLVEVPPLLVSQVEDLVRTEAERVSLGLDSTTSSRIIELCNQFLPTSAGPEAPLQLVNQARHYLNEKVAIGESEPVTSAFIEKVFAVYSGLPRFVVSRQETRPVSEIRDWFRSRIIGQRDAIEAVVQMITLFKAGLHDAQRPIGSFLFVGPTGVGKTELARTLASYLFGSEKRLLRFDLSEFKDYHSFQMLIGDPEKPSRPARLVDPVRAQPFQVVLLDEIDKAHANVWDLLLQLLDDGRLTPAGGPSVNFRNTILIATANVGAQALDKRPMGFTSATLSDEASHVQSELEAFFRPELLNRFQHIVRFHRLTKEEVTEIARAEMSRTLEREGIVGRKLSVDIDRDVVDLVVSRGYDNKYGARALKRQIQQQVVMPIATLLMERRVEDTSILRLTTRHGEVKVSVLESEDTKTQRREAEPLLLANKQKIDQESLQAMLVDAQAQIVAIVSGTNLAKQKSERADLELRRRAVDFWSDTQAAALVLENCDQIDRVIERIDRLQGDQLEISAALLACTNRDALSRIADRALLHVDYVAQAHRELRLLGRDGVHDALLEIRPIGHAKEIRDLLYQIYTSWADERKYKLRTIREPMTNDEPVMIYVAGPYAFGYLRDEAGMHRLRTERETRVAKVSVAAFNCSTASISLSNQKALKQIGQYGGRVRSRVEVAGSEFVVQNSATVADNRELAAEFAPSWLAAANRPDTVVRRYDIEPFLVRDFLTATTSGRTETLRAAHFHRLLCKRIDVSREANH